MRVWKNKNRHGASSRGFFSFLTAHNMRLSGSDCSTDCTHESIECIPTPAPLSSDISNEIYGHTQQTLSQYNKLLFHGILCRMGLHPDCSAGWHCNPRFDKFSEYQHTGMPARDRGRLVRNTHELRVFIPSLLSWHRQSARDTDKRRQMGRAAKVRKTM